MSTYTTGQLVTATTRDHGHIASSKVKSFTGRVVRDSHESTTASGTTYEWVQVLLAPNFKATRNFNTLSDSIEVVG
jgi:hypothetical protein